MIHILTGEYPPQFGGVSDYTSFLTSWLLKNGTRVVVYAPPVSGASAEEVRRLPGHFNLRSLASLHDSISHSPPSSIVLVQYVPHMYGMKGMNLLFVLWLWLFCPRRVWVMFHEIAYPLERGQSWRETVLAIVQRAMAMIVLRSAARVFVSIPGWVPQLRRLAHPLPPTHWLPIPSNIKAGNFESAQRIREQCLEVRNGWIVGHFGTYGSAITRLLEPILARVLEDSRVHLLLIGRGSRDFMQQFVHRYPEWGERIRCADSLSPEEVSNHLLACDLLLQPYPDGASTRRTSLMAGLALGVPVVSNLGFLSEPFWNDANSLGLASTDPSEMTARLMNLLNSPEQRHEIASNAKRLYESTFSLDVIGSKLIELAKA